MTHLFISHSTRDGGPIAQQLSAALEAAGHRCWIAPRDVKPGVPYPGQIVTAIEASAGLVLIVTPAANESLDVLQEIQLASQHRKTIAPVVVDRTSPSDDLHYYLGVRHQIPWSDAEAAANALLRSFPVVELPTSPGMQDALTYEVWLTGPDGAANKVIDVIREFTVFDKDQALALIIKTATWPHSIVLAKHLTYLSAFNFLARLKEVGASAELKKARG